MPWLTTEPCCLQCGQALLILFQLLLAQTTEFRNLTYQGKAMDPKAIIAHNTSILKN